MRHPTSRHAGAACLPAGQVDVRPSQGQRLPSPEIGAEHLPYAEVGIEELVMSGYPQLEVRAELGCSDTRADTRVAPV
ncbi:hypothetical protein [Nocardioides sp.]|uniref:hypothetical protein n=1 Tax=Nocardioides sp. TaxID=35761 RepID=UPI002E34531D|nr:hypothetical protein [Nocardioides sp.]